MTHSRRELLIAGAAAVTVQGCKQPASEDPFFKSQIKPAVPGSAGLRRGHQELVSSVCGQCVAGCAIQVRVVEGRAVKVDGMPDYPINRGSIGPKGQAGTGMLYHRDRIKGPMRREGARGSGKLVPVTWDVAIAEIAAQLKVLREKGEARSLVLLSGEPRGPMRDLWSRFAQAYGTPNLVDHRAVTDGAKGLASLYMQGVNEFPSYDWDRTRYVLGMGSSHLESWCQTIHMMRASSQLRHGMPGKRVKFVQVGPRYSTSSMKADEWVSIAPATYGAFVLGLAHVLIRDKLYDEKFVAEQTFGFEEFTGADGVAHQGFKDLVMSQWTPARASAMCGAPADVIERIAHEMAEFRPAIAVADPQVGSASNGLGAAMAVHALNALLGSIERPGGVLIQQRASLAPWAALAPDEVAKAGLNAPRLDGSGQKSAPLAEGAIHHLPAAMLSGKPYPAQAVFLHFSNPAFSKPGGKQWLEALAAVPLVVSFSPLADESTLAADFVLPDHSYLERFEYVEPAPALGAPIIGLRQPVVQTLHDTRQTGEVVVQLAKQLGGPVGAAFGWESYRAALDERLAGLVEQKGANAEADDAEGLVEAMKEGGGWWLEKPDLGKLECATPSKKFEFYSQAIASRLAAVAPDALEAELQRAGVLARGDLLCLPHFEPPRFSGAVADYPFVLLPYRAINYAEGGIRHLRRLVELPLVIEKPRAERLEVNDDDARRLSLKNNDLVVVETPAGSKELHVMVRPGIQPGTLGLPLGYGQWPPRPNEVTGGYPLLDATSEDAMAGVFALLGTRARIRRKS